ncbi:DUF2612 domain-containing protein [Methylobacterium frigidaeris]|uniref:DUF2612 domain-containing protein n=1 Tax=Methylobacterium frigidaeris TaxID=2038277 RepID=A0AA37M5S0_9HYPH|nr:DUF2612 domain-containing protein [Methylobacterium frigidaeris]GJD63742.1 hypothetical protein MPEAHAMD_3913 [Methylobacterium frigidaeris]
MTGPAYPPQHDRSSAPGGQLPVTEQIDVWTTVLSQFANSPILTAILEREAVALDQRPNLDAFYRQVWDLDTAEGYGLDVWGRIVGVNRVLKVVTSRFFGFAESAVQGDGTITGFNDALLSFGDCLGFAEALPGSEPYGYGTFQPLAPNQQANPETGAQYGPFYDGRVLYENFRLNDESYRRLIYAKAQANICDGGIPAINAILMRIFPDRGNAYVTERVPDSYFGFAEATAVHPSYALGFNTLEPYPGPYVGFAEALPGDEAFGVSPLYGIPGLGLTSPALSAQRAPFYSGQANPYAAITYTFEFALSQVELAIVQQSGVLPTPTGVAAAVVIRPR